MWGSYFIGSVIGINLVNIKQIIVCAWGCKCRQVLPTSHEHWWWSPMNNVYTACPESKNLPMNSKNLLFIYATILFITCSLKRVIVHDTINYGGNLKQKVFQQFHLIALSPNISACRISIISLYLSFLPTNRISEF